MAKWIDIWPRVRQAVKVSTTPNEAAERISKLRGKDTTWAAVSREWRRQKDAGNETVSAWDALRVKSTKVRTRGQKHLVIPDTQVKPGVPLDHFKALGRYIAEQEPDVVVHLGDHWDMPSLSSYESGTRKAHAGRHKLNDIKAGNKALEIMEEEMVKAGFQPQRKVLLEGNHDGFAPHGRIGRYMAETPWDEGLITPDMFADSWLGWERYPFLEAVEIDGIKYCHLFPYNRRGQSTMAGMRTGASSAQVQLSAVGQSCTAGHRQGKETYEQYRPGGRAHRAIIAGSFYMHDEQYLGPTHYWKGILVKNGVSETNPNHYDLMEVSMEWLLKKYK